MIKKIIWTIIILAPIMSGALFLGFSDGVLFNTGGAMTSWTAFVQSIKHSDGGAGSWMRIIWTLIMALIYTAPFWYAWKGTFMFKGIPPFGLIIRIVILSILIFVPGLLLLIDGGESVENGLAITSYVLTCILSLFALIGLWFKS